MPGRRPPPCPRLRLASTLESRANITTVDEFADMLLSAPTFIANLIRSKAAATAVAGRQAALSSEVGTMTDTAVLDVATQTALTGDVVDISTAEAM
eukprot:3088650-Prymnesium_polylepis.1